MGTCGNSAASINALIAPSECPRMMVFQALLRGQTPPIRLQGLSGVIAFRRFRLTMTARVYHDHIVLTGSTSARASSTIHHRLGHEQAAKGVCLHPCG